MDSKIIFKQQNYIQGIVLITAWLLGNIWTFQWFLKSLKYSSFFYSITLAVAVITLSVSLALPDFSKLNPLDFQLKLYPSLLMIAGELGAIFLKWFIHIPQLTLLCFLLASYGLLGLFININTWYKGLSLAALAACIVPFSVSFNSGLGFPVRVITAHTVAQIISDLHLSAISSQDIIIMENGIAQVDLPCSGMKSLWTGTVFLLGATWLERRQLGFHWLLVAIANLIFLIIANIIRILILVIIIEVWQQRQIAEVLHLPLGIIGFIIASVLTWILLQKSPHQGLPRAVDRENKFDRPSSHFNWLLTIIIILSIIGQFQPFKLDRFVFKSIELPPTIVTKTLPLTTSETNFFNNPAHLVVQKIRFKHDELSGSMLIVASDTWQAHHPPELCFLGNGFKVDKMNSKFLAPFINARWLSLQNGELSATYWFQSERETTDDFISRIWENITHPHKTWVLISILFDRQENPDSLEIQDFANTIHQTINQNLHS